MPSENVTDGSLFLWNGSSCSIVVTEQFLEIKLEHQAPPSGQNSPFSHSSKSIAFSEILNIKYEDPRILLGKRRPSLSVKRKIKQPFLAINTVKRGKDYRWKLTCIKLKSSTETLCREWAKKLHKKLEEFVSSRPMFLLVFINPYGGRGTGQSVYEKKVKPIFEAAQIKTTVVTTSFRHHAKTYIETHDLSDYDGIIAVGGDGMLNEVINGLISQTQSRNGINLHAQKQNPRSCPKFQRPQMRVGVIPAGSTDCVSYVTQGINDAETSALHIVLGDSHPVDVVSLHNADGIFQQFSMSLTGYGYFGDMLRHSENYRWMGPPRYTFVGANVFLRNKSYSGEVHYLPAEKKEDPASSSFCRTPCSTCQDGLADESMSLFTPTTPNVVFLDGLTFEEGTELEDSLESTENEGDDSFRGVEDVEKVEQNGQTTATVANVPRASENLTGHENSNDREKSPTDENFKSVEKSPLECGKPDRSKNDLMTNGIDETGDTMDGRPKTLSLLQPMESSEGEKESWKVIKGDFMSINGVALSCACERSPLGLSPYCHLCDGAMDLIIVKACSRFDFLRYMIAHTGRGDRFGFPYVEVQRVKAFQFIPSSPLPRPPPMIATSASSPGSASSASGGESSVHISLEDLSVKYKHTPDKKKKRSRSEMKRSQSMVVTNRVSSWNSDGEIVEDPNMTVRVHRGLILMFCRGVEDLK